MLITLALNLRTKIQINMMLVRVAILPLLTGAGKPPLSSSQNTADYCHASGKSPVFSH